MHGRWNRQLSVILVCVTENYIKKISGGGTAQDLDNCLYEFDYAARTKGRSRMLAAVMEKRLAAPVTWFGKLGATLGGQLYYQALWCEARH